MTRLQRRVLRRMVRRLAAVALACALVTVALGWAGVWLAPRLVALPYLMAAGLSAALTTRLVAEVERNRQQLRSGAPMGHSARE